MENKIEDAIAQLNGLIEGLPFSGYTGDVREVYRLATEALGKQVKLKVHWEYDGYADGYPVYDRARCPRCDRLFEDGEDDNFETAIFCPDCGQRIDWEREVFEE